MNMKCLTVCCLAVTTAASAQTIQSDTASVRIGYSQSNQRSTAGAIEKLGEERMKKGFVVSSLDALSGQAAGVQVQSGGNQEAMVSAVRVRGTTSLTGGNDPLVIIDGVTSDLATLATIYPADIESFTILKDASETAQYGSRGAAGVIEVATKKGSGGQFQIAYDGNMGFESVYKNVEMLSADAFRQSARQLGVNILDGGSSTNYPSVITRTGFVQNHHVAFGGGTESSKYRASVGLMDHRTVIDTYQLRNYIAKLDISQKAFDDHVEFDLGIFGSIQKNALLPSQWKLFYSAATFNPTIADGRNADGGYDQVTEALWINNPNSLLKMKDDEESGHFNVHVAATAMIGYDISLKLFGSYSYNTDAGAHYYPTFVWSHGEAYRADTKSEELLGSVSLSRDVAIGASTVSLLALAEAQKSVAKGFNVTTTDFSSDAYGYDNLAAGATRPWKGTASFYEDAHLESFMVRAIYSLHDRYSLTVNARADGSSKVGHNNRWGFFPSVSGAWVASDESWLRPLTWLSLLKVRMGVGRSGNLGAISSYNSMQLIQPNGVVSVGGAIATTQGSIRNANPDLKWEVKHTVNVGVDAGFWDKRIMVTLDYYRSRTTDMLYMYDVPVPPFTYDKLLANLGEMKNSGLEIGFGITPLRTRNTELSANLNVAFERNRLLSLNGNYNGQYLTAPEMKGIAALSGAGFHGASDVVMQVVGQPLGVFYLPHCYGLTQQADGSYRYDVSDEKYICGQATPKMTLGSMIALRYRLWDVSLQVNGAFGHKIYNGTALTYMNMQSLPNYNVMSQAPSRNIQDQTISDYWLERGDYLNFDYVTVGWNVPVGGRYVRALRLSASVNNLATITGYSGLTPMINSSVVNSTLGIDDKSTFPVYRSYSIGLSIKF